MLKKCGRCSVKKLPRHAKWFELYGITYGENDLGLPEHLFTRLPVAFCSPDCLMEYVEDAIKQVDKFYSYNSRGVYK